MIDISQDALKGFVQFIASREQELPGQEPSMFVRQIFNERLGLIKEDFELPAYVPKLDKAKDIQDQLIRLSLVPHPEAYRQLAEFARTCENKALKGMAVLAAQHNRNTIENQLSMNDVYFVSENELPGNYYIQFRLEDDANKERLNELLEMEMEMGDDLLEDWLIQGDTLLLYLDTNDKSEVREFLTGLTANLNEEEQLVQAKYEILLT